MSTWRGCGVSSTRPSDNAARRCAGRSAGSAASILIVCSSRRASPPPRGPTKSISPRSRASHGRWTDERRRMSVTRLAHAKLNVFLRVLGARDDGYHDVETVVLPLELHDVVTVEPADGFAVTVRGSRAAELARAGGEALVERAARAWAHETGRQAHEATITVDKRLPVAARRGGRRPPAATRPRAAAGLGGGSADAAATILALDELHGTGLDTETLLRIAAAVGSDVPALTRGGPVYADGRGDRITPVHAQTTHWVVVPASFAVRTPDAYAWWDDAGATGPDAGALIAALEAGNDETLGPALFDDLQPVVAARHPEVGDTISALLDAGALGAVMSGSGPTVVALARHMAHADQIAAQVPAAFVTSGPPRTMGPFSGVV